MDNKATLKRNGRLCMFLMMATALLFTVIGSQFTAFSINDATIEALGPDRPSVYLTVNR
jgi:hypothetical protein